MDHQKSQLEGIIDGLDLPDENKRFLKLRWLDQMLWVEAAALGASRWYHLLRVVAIAGGIVIPALLSLSLNPAATGGQLPSQQLISVSAFALGLIVAICAATLEFFKFGDRWRHYRRLAEALKSEGWQFFQSAGAYRGFPNLVEAYPTFATRIEALLQGEVQLYLNEVTAEKSSQEASSTPGGDRRQAVPRIVPPTEPGALA